jgi:hypothetical protein
MWQSPTAWFQTWFHPHCMSDPLSQSCVSLNWTALNLDPETLPGAPYGEQATPAHLDLDQKKKSGISVGVVIDLTCFHLFAYMNDAYPHSHKHGPGLALHACHAHPHHDCPASRLVTSGVLPSQLCFGWKPVPSILSFCGCLAVSHPTNPHFHRRKQNQNGSLNR